MNKPVCWLLGILTGIVTTVGAEAIVVAAVPTKTYTNDIAGTQIIGSKYADKGLFDIIMNANQIAIDDVPVIKTLLDNLLKEGGMGDLIGIDYDMIKDVKFTDPSLSEKLKNAVKITATLTSLNVNLGRFGDLAMFKEWTPVNPTDSEIKAHPKLYYYSNGEGTYARAFDDSGNPVAGVTGETKLYYANLSKIVVTEIFEHISVRVPELTVNEFVEQFLGTSGLDPAIKASIGDTKLIKLDTIQADDFLLKNFIDNPDLFNILEDMTGKTKDEITIGDLKVVSTDDVHLVSVIPNDSSSKKLYDLLVDALSTPAEDIVIGQLSGIEVSKCHLSTVIDADDPSNEKLYKLLSDITGKDKKDILVSDLDGVDIGKAKLTSFLDYAGNERLYAVLLDVTGMDDYHDLTVSSMDGANMKLVRLSTFLEPAENPDLYNVILDMVHKKDDPAGKGYATRTAEQVLLDDLDGLDFGNVRLSSVWGSTSKDTGNAILDVLLQDDSVTIGNLQEKIDTLTIHQLFGANCFTQDRSKAFVHYDSARVGENLVDAYSLNDGVYEFNTELATADTAPADAWYISADAGVWLLFAYTTNDTTEIDVTNGRALKFSPSNVTYHDLQEDASSFSDVIGKARLYQLITAGVVTDDPASPYVNLTKRLNLSQVLDLIP